MTTEQDIHGALMARVETVTTAPLLFPRVNEPTPEGEHIRVAHLPNDNERLFFEGETGRMGFIVLTLVSPLGPFEIEAKVKAQAIADVFPIDYEFSRGTFRASVYMVNIKQGQQVNNRWETPIWIDYRGFA